MHYDPLQTAVTDADAIARMAYKLSGEHRELWDVLDLSCIIEAIVLNERLVLLDSNDPSEERENDESMKDLLRPWFEEGVLVFESFSTSSGEPDIAAQEDDNAVTVAAEEDPTAKIISEAATVAEAERAFGCPSVLLTMHEPIYESHATVRDDHAICDLLSRHDELRDALMEYRRKNELPTMRYKTFPIPPLPTTVFENCDNFREVVDKALDVRSKFAELRRRLVDLRGLLGDPEVTPKKKAREIRSWEKTWKTLAMRSGDPQLADMADTNDFLLKGTDLIAQQSTSLMSWKTAVASLAEQIANLFYSFRVRILHGIASRYKRYSNHDINSAAERLLKKQISSREIKDVVETIDVVMRFKDELRIVPVEKYRSLKAIAEQVTENSPQAEHAGDAKRD